jgi:hypothetical protein
MEGVEVRDRLEVLAREVRLISLGLFGIAHLHRNGDDTGPLIDFATQVEEKLLALALEMYPDEENGLSSGRRFVPKGDEPRSFSKPGTARSASSGKPSPQKNCNE